MRSQILDNTEIEGVRKAMRDIIKFQLVKQIERKRDMETQIAKRG